MGIAPELITPELMCLELTCPLAPLMELPMAPLTDLLCPPALRQDTSEPLVPLMELPMAPLTDLLCPPGPTVPITKLVLLAQTLAEVLGKPGRNTLRPTPNSSNRSENYEQKEHNLSLSYLSYDDSIFYSPFIIKS